MSLEVNGLSKQYGEQWAVREMQFAIPTGQVVGFLGPNGAGKSTTMKMITGYVTPDAGRITVCGEDISKAGIGIRKRIGYLPESNPLYYDMYVREYLQFLAGVHGLGAQAEKRIDAIIEQTGLSLEAKKTIGSLSKGYKQRVGLAQAIIHNPDVLILDEPTSGLDPNQIVEIRDLIRTFGAHKTVVLSTHIMQEVEAMCDRVIIINRGKLLVDMLLPELRAAYPNQGLEEIFRQLTQTNQA
ncbi:MAG: ATP-binding cassette domain-containing protein [Chitinophagaceae bacterium]